MDVASVAEGDDVVAAKEEEVDLVAVEDELDIIGGGVTANVEHAKDLGAAMMNEMRDTSVVERDVTVAVEVGKEEAEVDVDGVGA